jgi:imidazolonepropionase-like amidohydrolase
MDSTVKSRLKSRATPVVIAVLSVGIMAIGMALDHASATRAQVRPRAIATPQAPITAIVNARVFDGERLIPSATVVFEGDHILAVGPDVTPPPGAAIIDGAGQTLMPGFIDAHTHASGDALERAVVFGVTTELDMFTDPDFARLRRAEQVSSRVTTRSDLRSAGVLATAPGGHGTEFGIPIPTLASVGDAQSFIDARIAEGSDYIKIVEDDGSGYGLTWPTLSHEELAAVVRAAHWRQKLAVVHIGSQRDAMAAIDAGADALVHLFSDSAPTPDFVARAVTQRLVVVPTLTVLESETGHPSGASLVHDARIAPFLINAEVSALRSTFPFAGTGLKLAHARAAVAALKAAGVPILAGTDAPNPGTTHGASVHRELELLVGAGLTPIDALTAATSTPAKVFGLLDRGRIAPGLRADLILVNGNPVEDITATRAITHVWRNGAVVVRYTFVAR